MARKPEGEIQSAQSERLIVDAALIEGFVSTFLQGSYDNPCPIPEFHRRLWELECSSDRWVAVAAPRGHAKSTAGNHAYLLANLLFGNDDFALVISSTERMAVAHLKLIKDSLHSNPEMLRAFHAEIIRDVETELVCRVKGREFCVMAFGAGANMRGALWRQRRPSLIMGDDIEDPETVMNPLIREKLMNWWLRTVLPIGSDYARFRILGTILHSGALLELLLNDDQWTSRRFRAHKDFDDFSEILWPEKFPQKRLERERQGYINRGDASGYSQEYLSHPIATLDAFFRPNDLQPMSDGQYRAPKLFYGAVDFAASQKEHSDFTVLSVGGLTDDGTLCVVDVGRGRWDPLTIINEWFRLDALWKPEWWIAEEGVIRKVLGPFLNSEMKKRNHYFNIILKTPVKDKVARASSFQARCRADGVRFDQDSSWYVALEMELLSFPRGIHDDQVDSLAWLGLGLDEMTEHPTPVEVEEEEVGETRRTRAQQSSGRSAVTGY